MNAALRMARKTEDRAWYALRDLPGASVKELAEASGLSESGARLALTWLLREGRVKRQRDGRSFRWRIVSPQRDGINAPRSRPRQTPPEIEAVRTFRESRRRGPAPSGRRGRTGRKDTAELVRAVERVGGQVRRTGSGHLLVRGPGGVAVFSATPSDPRSWRNGVAELRRAGLPV
jgi:DNA-binding transcriptional ArsR family regulator